MTLKKEYVADAFEDIIASHAFPPHVPGMFGSDTLESTWRITGVPIPRFNMVTRTQFDRTRPDEAIERTLEPFRSLKLPMYWVVGPGDRPTDLPLHLARAGLRSIGSLVCMSLNFHETNLPIPFGTRVKRVCDESDLAAWIKTLGSCFGIPADMRAMASRVFEASVLGHDPQTRLYTGFVGDEPVATSMMRIAGGSASLWFVGALPHARGRGLGRAMTLVPLREAKNYGCHKAIIGATPMATASYQKLGFRKDFSVETFEADFSRGSHSSAESWVYQVDRT